jgi:hypothetical protein
VNNRQDVLPTSSDLLTTSITTTTVATVATITTICGLLCIVALAVVYRRYFITRNIKNSNDFNLEKIYKNEIGNFELNCAELSQKQSGEASTRLSANRQSCHPSEKCNNTTTRVSENIGINAFSQEDDHHDPDSETAPSEVISHVTED